MTIRRFQDSALPRARGTLLKPTSTFFQRNSLPPDCTAICPLSTRFSRNLTIPALSGNRITEGLFRQRFGAPVIFLWSVIPYRTEWRYAYESDKVIAIDAGHLCQNLYFACEALDCGTCAVGAYDQKTLDSALGLDGTDEFVIYCAPVGKR